MKRLNSGRKAIRPSGMNNATREISPISARDSKLLDLMAQFPAKDTKVGIGGADVDGCGVPGSGFLAIRLAVVVYRQWVI